MSRSLTKVLLQHAAFLTLGVAMATGAPALARKKPALPVNRGLEPARQPVVQRTDFVFDAVPDGGSGLSRDEALRLRDWFDAIQLGYGDRIYILSDGSGVRNGVSGAISDLVASYGLLVTDRAPATLAGAPAGAVRVTVSRFIASVPGCPDWRDHNEADFQGGLSYDYGCATNGNLAAMIANPEDLVRGRDTTYDRQNTVRDRAIKAYRAGPIK